MVDDGFISVKDSHKNVKAKQNSPNRRNDVTRRWFWRSPPKPPLKLAVNILAVPQIQYLNQMRFVINGIHYPIITNTDTVIIKCL